MDECELIHLLLRRKKCCSIILAWSFFKKHFLYPTPDTNPLSLELKNYILQYNSTQVQNTRIKQPEYIFREWFRSKWDSHKDYPSGLRGNPSKNDHQGKLAYRFEKKIWSYFDTLTGPNRIIKADKTSLQNLPEHHLGLFAIYHIKIPRDSAYIWGDFHEIHCSDAQWEQYSTVHSSCFELDTCKGKKRYILTGPLSLINHSCAFKNLTLDITTMLYLKNHSKRKKTLSFTNNQEIFVNYGSSYFDNQYYKCVCCTK